VKIKGYKREHIYPFKVSLISGICEFLKTAQKEDK
jgi:hypothetical protein